MPQIDWTPLRNALRLCRAAGAIPPIWWRDDDAVAPTDALDTLAHDAGALGMSVHLAVIPAHATLALAAYCQTAPFLPVVHGWAHVDHSRPTEKKNEFQTPRAGARAETAEGLARMQTLFETVVPMFVPPWNRVNADIVNGLSAQGYTHLSTYGARKRQYPTVGLEQINTHIDPIYWKGHKGLVEADHLIAEAARALTDRAEGRADPVEPFGLLTHHLVHDDAIWAFSRAFLTEMRDGGATPWHLETTT